MLIDPVEVIPLFPIKIPKQMEHWARQTLIIISSFVCLFICATKNRPGNTHDYKSVKFANILICACHDSLLFWYILVLIMALSIIIISIVYSSAFIQCNNRCLGSGVEESTFEQFQICIIEGTPRYDLIPIKISLWWYVNPNYD